MNHYCFPPRFPLLLSSSLRMPSSFLPSLLISFSLWNSLLLISYVISFRSSLLTLFNACLAPSTLSLVTVPLLVPSLSSSFPPLILSFLLSSSHRSLFYLILPPLSSASSLPLLFFLILLSFFSSFSFPSLFPCPFILLFFASLPHSPFLLLRILFSFSSSFRFSFPLFSFLRCLHFPSRPFPLVSLPLPFPLLEPNTVF